MVVETLAVYSLVQPLDLRSWALSSFRENLDFPFLSSLNTLG
jgi:hypothetical protein